MRLSPVARIAGIALAVSACHLADEDRCGAGFTYHVDDAGVGTCLETSGDSDDTDTGLPDAGAGDGGVTGLMEPCDGQDDCAGYDASYCLDVSYGSIVLNGCAIAGCTVAPDDCPETFTCCDLDPTYESMLGLPDTICMPPEYWADYKSFCLNGV